MQAYRPSRTQTYRSTGTGSPLLQMRCDNGGLQKRIQMASINTVWHTSWTSYFPFFFFLFFCSIFASPPKAASTNQWSSRSVSNISNPFRSGLLTRLCSWRKCLHHVVVRNPVFVQESTEDVRLAFHGDSQRRKNHHLTNRETTHGSNFMFFCSTALSLLLEKRHNKGCLLEPSSVFDCWQRIMGNFLSLEGFARLAGSEVDKRRDDFGQGR